MSQAAYKDATQTNDQVEIYPPNSIERLLALLESSRDAAIVLGDSDLSRKLTEGFDDALERYVEAKRTELEIRIASRRA